MSYTGGQPTWETQDGRIILISKLDDDHLTNIFNMIRSKCRFNYAIFDEMVMRGLWDADRSIMAAYEFKTLRCNTTRNGTVL